MIDPLVPMIESKAIKYEVINAIEEQVEDESVTKHLYLADWEMFKQAVFHPIVNAVKHNRYKGSIKVKFKLVHKGINSCYLEVSIKDSGYGIN